MSWEVVETSVSTLVLNQAEWIWTPFSHCLGACPQRLANWDLEEMLPSPPPRRLSKQHLKTFVSLHENTQMSVFIYSNETSKTNPSDLTKINEYFHWSQTMVFFSQNHFFLPPYFWGLGSIIWKEKDKGFIFPGVDLRHFFPKQTLGIKLARVHSKTHLLLFETPLSYPRLLHGAALHH